jgi:hypothetical protein
MSFQLMTLEEEKTFREQGYLLLPGVLDSDLVSQLLNEAKRLVQQAVQRGTEVREEYYHVGSYKLNNILRLSPVFDHLIDHPGYFGRLLTLIGHHIQLMGSEIFVRGASGERITGFHTDLGTGLQQVIPTFDSSFLQVKVQLFLTDLSKPDQSNFMLVPGSHCWRVQDSDDFGMISSMNNDHPVAKPIQVLASPGDAILFPHLLWHAVSPNPFGPTRYSITLRYGQLALRPLEFFHGLLSDPKREFTPRQRRILGDLGDEFPSPYRPHNQINIITGKT